MSETDKDRVAFTEVHARSIREYGVPQEEFDRYARRVLANALAAWIVEDGFMTIVERPLSESENMGREGASEIVGTVGVVAPFIVASMEGRIAERQREVATSVVDRAIANIDNWGSYFGHRSITKDDARRLIREALREVKP